MRRQEAWLKLADRLQMERSLVVAVCVFLNMRRSEPWISKALAVPAEKVARISAAANPLLRKSRRDSHPEGERVCTYCGAEDDLTRDHVQPRSRGGRTESQNLVWACRNCNSAKGDRTPKEWLG